MSRPVTVRACVNLPYLKVGDIAVVNPDTPYVKMCLEHQLIVPVAGNVAATDDAVTIGQHVE